MKKFKFPYMRYLISPPEIKPVNYVCRPVIPVRLSVGSKGVVFDALIDSGADECIFPGWVAKNLGFNLYSGEQRIFSGIGGSVLSYRHRTKLHIPDVEFSANIYYSHEWDDMPFGLLGEAGFFSQFRVLFNYTQNEIILTSN